MRSVIRETLTQALVDVPALVDRYRDANPDFVPAVTRWLEDLERDLGRLRHPLAGFAASQRAQVFAANDGHRPDTVTGTGRRAQRAVAALVLAAVEPPLRQEIADIERTFAEPQEQLARLVAVAAAHDRIPEESGTREAWLERIWIALPDGDGAAGIREYLAARLARVDRLYLLDEVMRNLTGTGDDA